MMIRRFVSGIAIGIANLIPGVSGGTMAVILGIYDPLIAAINGLISDRSHFKSHFLFLCQVGVGALVSIVLGSFVILNLLDSYYQATMFFFIGLIIASIPVVVRSHDSMAITPVKVILCLLALSVMILFRLLNANALEDVVLTQLSFIEYVYLGVSGFIAAGTMIIPGLSGSLILLVMGSYGIILSAIHDVDLAVISVVGVGAIFGLFLVSKGIGTLLKRFPSETYYTIIGLLLGSIVKLWPGIAFDTMSAVSLLSMVLGILLVRRLS